jgi:DNA-binding response OmpR family regulator
MAAQKVLCVEDEQFISDLYTRALVKAGYEVVVEADGQLALEQARSNNFDIILLDLMVPNLTGMEILSRLRKDVPGLKAKVIITTNLEQHEEAREQLEHQADGYIIKANVTPRELVKFLQTI